MTHFWKKAASFKSIGLYAYLPLYIFSLFYLLVCFIGSVALLINNPDIIFHLQRNTGISLPQYSQAQLIIAWTLLVGTPILLGLGYQLGIKINKKQIIRQQLFSQRFVITPNQLIVSTIAFLILSLSAIIQLAQLKVFANFLSWFDYDKFMAFRFYIYDKLNWWGFVNIYILIPITSVVFLLYRPVSRYGRILRFLPAVVAILLNISLFQKKSAITAEFIMLLAWLAATVMMQKAITLRTIYQCIKGLMIMGATLFVLLILPVIANQLFKPYFPEFFGGEKKSVEEVAALENVQTSAGKKASVLEPTLKIRTQFLVSYTLLGLFTRSAVPALYYPFVFPSHHPYYGLDIGLDIIGIGAMPDDNKVVWQVMNKNTDGSVAVPFQFALYSQVGVLGTLVLSFCLGFILAFLWCRLLLLVSNGSILWRGILGGMLLLFIIYITADSARNSLLASYGVLWGSFFIAMLYSIEKMLTRLGSFLNKQIMRNQEL